MKRKSQITYKILISLLGFCLFTNCQDNIGYDEEDCVPSLTPMEVSDHIEAIFSLSYGLLNKTKEEIEDMMGSRYIEDVDESTLLYEVSAPWYSYDIFVSFSFYEGSGSYKTFQKSVDVGTDIHGIRDYDMLDYLDSHFEFISYTEDDDIISFYYYLYESPDTYIYYDVFGWDRYIELIDKKAWDETFPNERPSLKQAQRLKAIRN